MAQPDGTTSQGIPSHTRKSGTSQAKQQPKRRCPAGSRHAMAPASRPKKRERPPGTRNNGAGSKACQPIAARRALGEETKPEAHTDNHKQNHRHRHDCADRQRRHQDRTANKTHAKALRQRNPPPPRKGVRTLFTTNAISGAFQRSKCSSIKGCVCVTVCVAGHRHATPCRVDLHGTGTGLSSARSRPLPRTNAAHRSIALKQVFADLRCSVLQGSWNSCRKAACKRSFKLCCRRCPST